MNQDIKVYRLTVGEIAANCFLMANENTKEVICFDPGAEGARIYQVIEEKGLKLTAIFLTHGHMDHIMAVDELKNLAGDGVLVYACEDEADVLETVSLNLSGMLGASYTTSADVLLRDDQELTVLSGIKMKCIQTPGHTKGGMCFYFPELDKVISGDTLFEGSIGRTDFPTGDHAALTASIKNKLYCLPENTIVYSGHGNETTIGKEKTSNYFVRA